jgi:hypothetical protein
MLRVGFNVEYLMALLPVIRTWEWVGRQALEVERYARRVTTDSAAH